MLRPYVSGPILWACLFSGAVLVQVPAKVDFRRDVQPSFETYILGWRCGNRYQLRAIQFAKVPFVQRRYLEGFMPLCFLQCE